MQRAVSRSRLVAGITNAVTNIPDAMASAVLAGLNPIQGLYAIMVGTPASALTTSSQLMTVAVTGAMALIVGESLAPVEAADKIEALIVLTVLVAVVQVALGLARAGTLVRFVSNAVLQGFLFGVAVNIVLSQFSDLTGYSSDLPGKVGKAIDTLLRIGADRSADARPRPVHHPCRHPCREDPSQGLLLLSRTSALDARRTRAGIGHPHLRSLDQKPEAPPTPTTPNLSLVAGLAVPAISIALVGLIQSAGVSKGTPNSDGTYPNMNRDFIGQGVGNAASGLFGGMPVGGSVSSTALLRQLGATLRGWRTSSLAPSSPSWSALFSGAVEVTRLRPWQGCSSSSGSGYPAGADQDGLANGAAAKNHHDGDLHRGADYAHPASRVARRRAVGSAVRVQLLT